MVANVVANVYSTQIVLFQALHWIRPSFPGADLLFKYKCINTVDNFIWMSDTWFITLQCLLYICIIYIYILQSLQCCTNFYDWYGHWGCKAQSMLCITSLAANLSSMAWSHKITRSTIRLSTRSTCKAIHWSTCPAKFSQITGFVFQDRITRQWRWSVCLSGPEKVM